MEGCGAAAFEDCGAAVVFGGAEGEGGPGWVSEVVYCVGCAEGNGAGEFVVRGGCYDCCLSGIRVGRRD